MDDQKQAENAVAQAENEVESPTTEEQVAESSASESEETTKGQDVEPDKKPTRAERRIRDFSERNKRLGEENEALKAELFSRGTIPQDVPPVFQPGEFEVDPQELQSRIDKFVEAKVTTTLARQEAIRNNIDNYKKTYEDHQRDLEDVVTKFPELDSQSGGNPELEKRFVELFDELNTQTTPDGKKVYQPKVKASKVAEMILGIKKAVSSSEASEFAGKTIKQEMERAVSPTGERSKDVNYELDELRNSARDSGDSRAWADYFKKAGIVKFSD